MGYAFCWSCSIWDFLWLCMDTRASHILLPLVAESLSFYVFSHSYNSPCRLLETSILFSRRWHCSSWLWFLPCPQSLVCFSESTLFTRAHIHCCTRERTQGAGRRVGRGVGLALAALRIPMGLVRVPQVRFSHRFISLLPAESPKYSHPELHPFNAP